MSRKPRFHLVGVPQHVIQRGNNREPCFHGDEDCQRYLGDLRDAADRNGCRLHAYVLMTNHVHLLVTPMQEHGVSHLMQDLGRKYVRYINHTYRRTGTLWEGRYESSLIDSDAYLLTCMRYIELQPNPGQIYFHRSIYGNEVNLASASSDGVVNATTVKLAVGRVYATSTFPRRSCSSDSCCMCGLSRGSSRRPQQRRLP